MGTLKLQKIGNSQGFRISKADLEKAGFDDSCEYELIAEKGVLILVKKKTHPSKWRFPSPQFESEDHEWMNADFEHGKR